MRNKIILVIIIFVPVIYVISCNKNDKVPLATHIVFPKEITAFSIFKGKIADLVPAKGVELLELSSTLFTDYAEKQRLIKLPEGQKMVIKGNGLPEFPEGTILAKTFYYLKDKTDPASGTQIIETRILLLKNGTWNAGTYQWNTAQTKAVYLSGSATVKVNWKTEDGITRRIAYHIPGQQECVSCHQSNDQIIPIGPKAMNLNRNIIRNGQTVNQLTDLQHRNLLSFTVRPSVLSALPAAGDTTLTLEHRARAYLEINCAHCHHPNGLAYRKPLMLSYAVPLSKTGISFEKNNITARMGTLGEMHMPKLGTTILDEKGVKLIRDYLNSIK
jgi:uncharacterized repeat protein (TIGR03806 family)